MLLPYGITMLPYTRLSWVHEFNPTRQISPTFVALPDTQFTVDGPRAARDAAKIELGTKFAVMKAKAFVAFDGEFSDRSQAYAGKAGFNLAW
jgi:outer membrane autotransporter protein